MADCEHDWEARTEAHSYEINRYQCKLCRAWGWRRWTRKYEPKRMVLSPMVVYMKRGRPVTEPNPAWLKAGGVDAISTGVDKAAKTTREKAERSLGEREFERRIVRKPESW